MLGEQIRKLRLARNISQTRLAQELNVTKQSVSNWENDNIMPSVDLLKRMCHYFSCSADYLLELPEQTSWIIEVSGLSIEEIAHIQQLVRDLQYLRKLRETSEEQDS